MKNIVSHVITGYLETLIQPLKNNQLNIDIWNGKLKMENLVFREDGLFNLGFPLKIIHGTAAEIKAEFSWSKLETEPVIASVKDVFLLTELDWQNFEQRQPILKSDKLNIKSAESEKEKIQTIQAFLDFTNKIIGTIQMNVENIHVIIQIPLVDQKVSVGFTMNSLKIENNEKSTLKNILKDIKFNLISIYMDPIPHVFDLEKFQEEMKEQLNMNNHEIIFELPVFETSFFRSKEKNVTHNNIFDIKFNEIDFGLTIPQLRSILQVSRAFQQHIKRRTYRLLMPPSDSEDFGKQFGYITKCASYNNSRMKFNVVQALQFLKNRSKYYKLYSEDMIKGKISKKFSKLSEKVNDETRVLLYNYSLAKYKLDNKNYDYKLKDDESMNFMGNYASILDSFNIIEFHFAAKRVVTHLKDADKIKRFSTIAESVKTSFIYTKQLQKLSFSIGAFSLFHENLNFISGIGRGSSKFLTAASDFGLNMIKANADFGIIEIRHVEPFIEQFMPFITGMSGAIPKTKIKFRTLAEPLKDLYNIKLPDISISLSNLDIIIYSQMHSFNFCLDQMNFSNAYEKRKKENVHIQLNIKSHCLFDRKRFLDNLVFDTNIVSTYNNTSELFDFKAKGQISDIKLYINPDFIFIINSFLPTIMKIITNEEFIKSFRRIVQTIKKLLDFKRVTSFKLTYGTIQTVIGDENLGFGFNASLTPFVIKESPETGHIVKFGMKNVDLYSLLNLTEKSYTKIESIKTKFTKQLNIIQSKNVTGNLSLRIYDLVRPILETIEELRKIGKVPIGFPDNKYMCKVENIDVNFLDYGHENVIFDIKIPKISMNLAGYTRALAIHIPSIVSNQGEKNIFEISEILFAYRMNESLKSVEMKTKDFYYKLLKEQILEPYEEVDINIPLFKISYNTLNFHFDKDFIPLIMNNLEPLKKYITKIAEIPAIINEIKQNNEEKVQIIEEKSENNENQQNDTNSENNSENSQNSDPKSDKNSTENQNKDLQNSDPKSDKDLNENQSKDQTIDKNDVPSDNNTKETERNNNLIDVVNDKVKNEVKCYLQFEMDTTTINIPEIKATFTLEDFDLKIAMRDKITAEGKLKTVDISQEDYNGKILSYDEFDNFLTITTDENFRILAKYTKLKMVLSPLCLALIINYFYSIVIPRIKLPDSALSHSKKSKELPQYNFKLEMEELKIILPQKSDNYRLGNYLAFYINSTTNLKPHKVNFDFNLKNMRFENDKTMSLFPSILDTFSFFANMNLDDFSIKCGTNNISNIEFTPENLNTLYEMSNNLKEMITETNHYFNEIPNYDLLSSLKSMPIISLELKPINISLCTSNRNMSCNVPFLTFRILETNVQTACVSEKNEYAYAISSTFDCESQYVSQVLNPIEATSTIVVLTEPRPVKIDFSFVEADPIHLCVNERLLRAISSFKVEGNLSNKVKKGQKFIVINHTNEKVTLISRKKSEILDEKSLEEKVADVHSRMNKELKERFSKLKKQKDKNSKKQNEVKIEKSQNSEKDSENVPNIEEEDVEEIDPNEKFMEKNTTGDFVVDLMNSEFCKVLDDKIELMVKGKKFEIEPKDVLCPLYLSNDVILSRKFKQGQNVLQIYSPISVYNRLPFSVHIYDDKNNFHQELLPKRIVPINAGHYFINDIQQKTKQILVVESKYSVKNISLSNGKFIQARTRYRRKRGVIFVELSETIVLYNFIPFDMTFSVNSVLYDVKKFEKVPIFNIDQKQNYFMMSCSMQSVKPPQETNCSLIKSDGQFVKSDFGSQSLLTLSNVNIFDNKIIVFVNSIVYNQSQHTLKIDNQFLKPGNSVILSSSEVNLSIDTLTKQTKIDLNSDNAGVSKDIFLKTLIDEKMTIPIHCHIKRLVNKFNLSVIVTLSDSILVENNLQEKLVLLPKFDIKSDIIDSSSFTLKENSKTILTFAPENYKFLLGDQKTEISLESNCNKIFRYNDKYVRFEIIDQTVVKKVTFTEVKEAPILVRNDINVPIYVNDIYLVDPEKEIGFAFTSPHSDQILQIKLLDFEFKFSLIEPIRCSSLKHVIDGRIVLFNMIYLKTGQLLIDFSYEEINAVPDFLLTANVNITKIDVSFLNKNNREILVLLLEKFDLAVNFDQTFVSSCCNLYSLSLEDQNPTAESPIIFYNQNENLLNINMIFRYDIFLSKIIPFISIQIQPLHFNLNDSLVCDIYNYFTTIQKTRNTSIECEKRVERKSPVELSLPWIEIHPIELHISYNKDKKRKSFYTNCSLNLSKIPFFGNKNLTFPGFFVSHYFGSLQLLMKELSHDYIDNGIDIAMKQFGFLSKIFNFFGINGYIKSILNLKQLEYKKLTDINTKINDIAISNHELLHGVFNQFFIDAISRAVLLVGVKRTYLMQAVNSEIKDFNVRMINEEILNDTIICKVSKSLIENKQIKIGLRHRTPILIVSNYLKNYNDNERALQKMLCNGNIAAIFIIENSRNISTNYFCISNDIIFVFDRKMTLAAKIPINQIKSASLLENTLTLFTTKEPIVFTNELSQAVKLFISTKTELSEI